MALTVGDRLRELRLKNNLTQEEVGKLLSISKQALFKYENNIVTNIPSNRIEQLANVYNVSPAYIMGWNETDSAQDLIKLLFHDEPEKLKMIQSIQSDGSFNKNGAIHTLSAADIATLKHVINMALEGAKATGEKEVEINFGKGT